MIGQVDVYGLYLPWLLVLAFGALCVLFVVRRLLAMTGLYRWVWHPALFDLALYVLLLYGISTLSQTPPHLLTRAPEGAHQQISQAGPAAFAGSTTGRAGQSSAGSTTGRAGHSFTRSTTGPSGQAFIASTPVPTGH
jgi:hypothetical protein